MLLSLSIDGYLLTMPADPLLYGLWFRLMISTYLIGYLLGLAPIVVREIQRRLDTGGDRTSKLMVVIFVVTFFGALLLEPLLRLYSTTQLQGKNFAPVLFLVAFIIFHLIKSRKEITELIALSRSSEARAPMVELSLRLTYLISMTILRVSLAFTALTVSSRGYHSGLYAIALLLVVTTCTLLRNHQDA